jgi:hypothetical protein
MRVHLFADMTHLNTAETAGQARMASESELETKKLHSGLCGVILLTAKADETSRYHKIAEKEKHA